jgi:hypothetical protein
MICPLTDEACHVLGVSSTAICPLDKEDTLLFRNPGTSLVRGCLDCITALLERGHHKLISTLSTTFYSSCIYPGFDASRPLRARTKIAAALLSSMPEGPRGPQYYCVMFAVYVPSSELAALTIFTVKMNARARGYRKSVSRR